MANTRDLADLKYYKLAGEQVKIQTNGNYTYIAKSPAGTAQATTLWQAFRIDETSGLIILFADGNTEYDNVATDLTLLNYQ